MMTEKYDYVANEKAKFFEEFELYFKDSIFPTDTKLSILINLVITKCAQKSLDAGFSGSWGDNGARSDFDALKKFVAGYIWATDGGKIPHLEYEQILSDYQKRSDPEYEAYLKLKEKFGE